MTEPAFWTTFATAVTFWERAFSDLMRYATSRNLREEDRVKFTVRYLDGSRLEVWPEGADRWGVAVVSDIGEETTASDATVASVEILRSIPEACAHDFGDYLRKLTDVRLSEEMVEVAVLVREGHHGRAGDSLLLMARHAWQASLAQDTLNAMRIPSGSTVVDEVGGAEADYTVHGA